MSEYAIARHQTASVSSDQDQEKSWISACRQGDTRAFNRLVLQYTEKIRNAGFEIRNLAPEPAAALRRKTFGSGSSRMYTAIRGPNALPHSFASLKAKHQLRRHNLEIIWGQVSY
jgi:hypothetical protein